jgi:hypothetical protein
MDTAIQKAMDPRDERDKTIGNRHPRRARWLLALGGLVLAAVFVWAMPQNRNDRERWSGGGVEVGSAGRGSTHSDVGGPDGAREAVGTTGSHDDAVAADAAVVREIETITGANDAMSLVGRRVDLHVDVQSRANDHAFWVGSPDNRLLVVMGRDNRNGAKRQSGAPASHAVEPVRHGQRAAISGVVRSIPNKEQRFNWNLTEDDERELSERKVYIHAESVSPESGT